MYIGQATKDILEMPRPSPPAIQLEKRYSVNLNVDIFSADSICIFSYIEEYGFPSTHAMFAAGIPLSLVLLSHQRYDVKYHFFIVERITHLLSLVQYLARSDLSRNILPLGLSQSNLSRHAYISRMFIII